MPLNATNISRITDYMCRAYACALGGSGYGIGATGDSDRAYDAAADLASWLAGSGEADLQNLLGTPCAAAKTKMDAASMIARDWRQLYLKTLTAIKALGLSAKTIDAYLSYLNYGAGGTNTALASPYWRNLHYRFANAYPTNRNMYFEITEGLVFGGVTYTNGLRKWVVTGAGTGTATAGNAVPDSSGTYLYAGGVPYLKVSGLTGSGVVTVTGTEYNPATGAFTTGKTWTATVTVDGDVALASGGGSAASANALIVASSLVAAASGITAGTIIVQAHKPTSRLAIPF